MKKTILLIQVLILMNASFAGYIKIAYSDGSGVIETSEGGILINASSGYVTFSSNVDVKYGNLLRIYDSTNSKYVEIKNDGTDSIISSSSGNVKITSPLKLAEVLYSEVTGVAPFSVLSNIKVENLNADLLDGYHASDIDLDFAFDNGKVIDGADSEANAVVIGNGINGIKFWYDGNGRIKVPTGNLYFDLADDTFNTFYIMDGNAFSTRYGKRLRAYDLSNSKYLELKHDGSSSVITSSSGGIVIPNADSVSNAFSIGDGTYYYKFFINAKPKNGFYIWTGADYIAIANNMYYDYSNSQWVRENTSNSAIQMEVSNNDNDEPFFRVRGMNSAGTLTGDIRLYPTTAHSYIRLSPTDYPTIIGWPYNIGLSVNYKRNLDGSWSRYNTARTGMRVHAWSSTAGWGSKLHIVSENLDGTISKYLDIQPTDTTVYIKSDGGIRIQNEQSAGNVVIDSYGSVSIICRRTGSWNSYINFILMNDYNNWRWVLTNPGEGFMLLMPTVDDRDYIGWSSYAFRGMYSYNYYTPSSIEKKENLKDVNESILDKIKQIEIKEFNYKGDDEKDKHIGPIAESFNAIIGSKENETVSLYDVAGVSLAGVKMLIERIEQLEKEVEMLKKELGKK